MRTRYQGGLDPMGGSRELKVITNPESFFHELVVQALGKQRIRVGEEAEFYLVNLLQKFISVDRLFARDEQGQIRDEPLCVLFAEALEEPMAEHQRLMFRHVGDVSLYISGFFQESLERKSVDVDYYIGMGGAAYRNVATREDVNRASLYSELSDRFGTLVDVLTEVSEQTQPVTNQTDLLKTYEKWVSTGSDHAERKLRQAGIDLTNSKGRKKFQ